jgi:hypothetical protein
MMGMTAKHDNQIGSIERFLLQNLEPVPPRQEFVKDLRGRLARPRLDQAEQLSTSQWIVLFLAGLAGCVMLVVGAIKAAISIAHTLKSVRSRASIN